MNYVHLNQCDHVWIANGGKGGDPVFSFDRRIGGRMLVMDVKCKHCGGETWANEPMWKHHQARENFESVKRGVV